MSMFRTLQSNPGTITLFQPSVSAAPALLHLLKTHSSHIPHATGSETSKSPSLWDKIRTGFAPKEDQEDTTSYILDTEPHTPTYDQLQLIRSYTFTANTNNHNLKSGNLNVFKHAFPKFVHEDPEHGTSFISEEDFDELVKRAKGKWFVGPLVVDWEKGVLANDEVSLTQLLKQYD